MLPECIFAVSAAWYGNSSSSAQNPSNQADNVVVSAHSLTLQS